MEEIKTPPFPASAGCIGAASNLIAEKRQVLSEQVRGPLGVIFTCPASRRASPLMLEKRPRRQRGVRGCAGGASCVLVLPSRHASPIRRSACGPRQHAQSRRAVDLCDVRRRAARRCGRVGLRRLNRSSCPGAAPALLVLRLATRRRAAELARASRLRLSPLKEAEGTAQMRHF